MATDEERLVVALEARLNDFERQWKRATGNAANQVEGLQNTSRRASRRLQEDMERAAQSADGFTGSLDRLGRASASYERSAKAITFANDNIQRSAARTQQTLTQLSFQVNDIATQLASGGSLSQALMQQGGQIVQIAQEADGGFKGMARAVASVITPVRVLGVGLTGLAAAGAYAYYQWTDQQLALRRALALTGNESGATLKTLNEIAEAAAKASGQTNSQTRATVAALAALGNIGPDLMRRIATIQKDFAATLGLDPAKANELLADSFDKPLEGYEQLTQRLRNFNAQVREQIRSAVASGDTDRARIILLEDLARRISKAAEVTGFWARQWERLKGFADSAGEAVVGAVNSQLNPPGRTQPGQGTDDVLASLERQKREIEFNLRLQSRLPDAADMWRQRLREVTAEIEKVRAGLQGAESAQSSAAAASERAAEAAKAERERRERETAARTTSSQLAMPDAVRADSLKRLIEQFQVLRKQADDLYPLQGVDERAGEEYRKRLAELRAISRQIRQETTNNGEGLVDRNNIKLLQDQETILRRIRPEMDLITEEARVQRMETEARSDAEKIAAAAARNALEARKQGVQAGGQEVLDARNAAQASNIRRNSEFELTEAFKQRRMAQLDALRTLEVETQAMGGSVARQEAARVEQQLMNDAVREYRRVTGDENASVPLAEARRYRELAKAIGEARQAQQVRRLDLDTSFERQIIGLPDSEQRIAQQLRQVFGDDGWQAQMRSARAEALRFNDQLRTTADLSKGFATDLASGLRSGVGFFDAITSAAGRFSAKLQDAAFEKFFGALVTGRNPFEMAPGMGSFGSTATGGGGLASLSPARFFNGITEAVSGGTKSGYIDMWGRGEVSPAQAGVSSGQSPLGTAFMGGMSALGGYSAARSGGVAGAITSVIGSTIQGFMSGGPTGALINGALAIAGPVSGKTTSNKDIAHERNRRRQSLRSHLASV